MQTRPRITKHEIIHAKDRYPVRHCAASLRLLHMIKCVDQLLLRQNKQPFAF